MTVAPSLQPDRAEGSGPDPARVRALTARIVATTGDSVTVRSPLAGEPLGEVPQSSAADVAAAFERAAPVQRSWAATTHTEREAVLLRLHDLILDRQDEIVDLIVWESGKARKHAFDEPLHAALTARYYGRRLQRILGSRAVNGVFPD